MFCYECHDELLHNPVLLSDDIAKFAELVLRKGLSESEKTDDRDKLGKLIMLFHEIIETGLNVLLNR